jgi:hypothetical protein
MKKMKEIVLRVRDEITETEIGIGIGIIEITEKGAMIEAGAEDVVGYFTSLEKDVFMITH